MTTYRDKDGGLHVIDAKFAYLLPKGCVEVPKTEIKTTGKPAKKVKK